MPESMQDRCAKDHEYAFLFAKSARYYFDHSVMLEIAKWDGRQKNVYHGSAKYGNSTSSLTNRQMHQGGQRWANSINGIPARNRCSVWAVPTRGFKWAHFATFQPDLIRPCIEAGCPPDDVVLHPFMGAGTTHSLYVNSAETTYSDYVRLEEERLGEE